MNSHKINLLAQCIVNRTIGHDVQVTINAHSDNSSVTFQSNMIKNTNKALSFQFGCFDEKYEVGRAWVQIIIKRYPVAKQVHPALFAMLHEVGHVHAPANLTVPSARAMVTDSLSYRDLPDESFADKWAADFIKKNKLIVTLWDKQLRSAL